MDAIVVDCSQEPIEGVWPVPQVVPLTGAEQQAQEQAAVESAQVALEQGWAQVRAARDAALAASDWLVSPPSDLPPELAMTLQANRSGWLGYRQALRDLPSAGEDPTVLVWPYPPLEPKLVLPPNPFPLEQGQFQPDMPPQEP
jgi:hypothetical protein